MSLLRQSRSYLVIGGLQWLLDWVVMVALSHAGIPVRQANVAGRVCGALMGYWANGKFTFAGEGTALGRVQFRRFVLMWIGTTIISTWAIGRIDDALGLRWAWLAKPVVELGLAAIGFTLSKHWVYRR